MKKYILILLCCFIIMSCQTHRYTRFPRLLSIPSKICLKNHISASKFSHILFIRSSSMEDSTAISYFIMREKPRMFEIHLPDDWKMIMGNWEITNDTVYLNPMYEYYTKENEYLIREISLSRSACIAFPKKSLKRRNLLIDKIEYNIVGPDSTISDSSFILNAVKYTKIPQKVPTLKEIYKRSR